MSLLDLGDADTPSAENGEDQQVQSRDSFDPFDPFGPSPTEGTGSDGVLLDFSFETSTTKPLTDPSLDSGDNQLIDFAQNGSAPSGEEFETHNMNTDGQYTFTIDTEGSGKYSSHDDDPFGSSAPGGKGEFEYTIQTGQNGGQESRSPTSSEDEGEEEEKMMERRGSSASEHSDQDEEYANRREPMVEVTQTVSTQADGSVITETITTTTEFLPDGSSETRTEVVTEVTKGPSVQSTPVTTPAEAIRAELHRVSSLTSSTMATYGGADDESIDDVDDVDISEQNDVEVEEDADDTGYGDEEKAQYEDGYDDVEDSGFQGLQQYREASSGSESSSEEEDVEEEVREYDDVRKHDENQDEDDEEEVFTSTPTREQPPELQDQRVNRLDSGDYEVPVSYRQKSDEGKDQPHRSSGSTSSTDDSEGRRSRALSKSFEEYEMEYQEYKPPKRYVKPEEKTKSMGPQTFIMGLPRDAHFYTAPPKKAERSFHSTSTDDGVEREVVKEEVHKEIVTAEDKQEDGLEACPSLGSLKSRFESADAHPPPMPVREVKHTPKYSSVPPESPKQNGMSTHAEDEDVLKENIGEREEFHFDGMSSVMSKWKQGDVSVTEKKHMKDEQELEEVRKAKASSFKAKYNREDQRPTTHMGYMPQYSSTKRSEPDPSKPRPPVVNREEEDKTEEELPPPETTKNLLARFQSLETKGGSAERKEVHRITPPRDEKPLVSSVRRDSSSSSDEDERKPQREVIRSGEKMEKEEEELPPSNFTKNMLAKFKTLESETNNLPPPTPERFQQIQKKTTVRTYGFHATNVVPHDGVKREKTPEFECGTYENVPVRQVEDYNPVPEVGEISSEPVIDHSIAREDDRTDEGEFPEYGFTKNLLAKFKTIESESMKSGSAAPALKKSPQPQRTIVQSSIMRGAQPVDISHVRKGSSVESLTKSETSSSVGDHSDRYHDNEQYDGGEYAESEPMHNPDVIRECDRHDEEELPEHGFTQNLLAKFKSMESPSAAPLLPNSPKKSPSRSTSREVRAPVSISRRSGGSVTDSMSDSGSVSSDHGYREQYINPVEGGEYESEPAHRIDVVRETDQENEDELPPPNTTRKLMAHFQMN